MRQRQKPIITIGVSSLLLIFLSLCLIIFAVLSLVSARADLSLSENMARRTRIYYEAESSAADLLSSLDEALVSHYQIPRTKKAIFPACLPTFPGKRTSRGLMAPHFPLPYRSMRNSSFLYNLSFSTRNSPPTLFTPSSPGR